MLGLRGAHQPPHRRTRQIRDILTGQTHRAVRQHDQHAGSVAGQPRLQHPPTPRAWPHTPTPPHRRFPSPAPTPPCRQRRYRWAPMTPVTTPHPTAHRRCGEPAPISCALETGRSTNSRTDRIGQARSVGQVRPTPPRCRPVLSGPAPATPPRRADTRPARRTATASRPAHRPLQRPLQQADRVQRRVHQHRMDTEAADFHSGDLRHGDFGEDLISVPPHRPQTLKRRTVLIAPRGQSFVGVGHIHRRRPDRRPHRQIGGRRGRARAQHALGMQTHSESD